MKVLFLSNIPSPYRLDFFNQLGKYIDLTVIFEAERNYQLNEQWYSDTYTHFKAIFLKRGAIEEKRVNWKVIKQINGPSQDLIVVTNYAYFTELVALLYIKGRGFPYCLEIDGGIIRKEKPLLKAFKKFLINNARAYISPSTSSDDYLAYYGADREIIYRYPFTSLFENDIIGRVPTDLEKMEYKKNLGVKEEKMVLSVGQFIHRKGFDVLLDAAKQLPSEYGFYFVGGEPLPEYLDFVNKNELNNVHFVSFKSKASLRQYYIASDLFVLPTREDVWGLVINEAMAKGLPVITTDKCVAGLELVENGMNGYLVAVDDEVALAEKITAILGNDELRARMGKSNLDKIGAYTIENMVEKHKKIFCEVLSR